MAHKVDSTLWAGTTKGVAGLVPVWVILGPLLAPEAIVVVLSSKSPRWEATEQRGPKLCPKPPDGPKPLRVIFGLPSIRSGGAGYY